MNKKTSNIIIFILSIVLGFIIISQYTTVKETLNYFLPNQKIQEINSQLEQVNEQKEDLKEEISILKEKIKEYTSNITETTKEVNDLKEELEKYIIMAGYSDVKGPGVIITLENPPEDDIQYNNSNLVTDYEYLLLIISRLNAAGAEAISINNQRYTAYTEIVPVGSHVNINGVSFVPPFEIRAIGNKQALESVLNFKGGVVYEMKNLYNYQIEIEVKDEVQINRHLKPLDFKFAKPLKNSE